MKNVLFAVVCALASTPALAQAPTPVVEEGEGGGAAVVIQNRKFRMGHEFTLSSGVVPLDAFYKGVVATGRYTLHFDDFQAWEIVGGTYSFNIETDLRRQLRELFAVGPEQLDQLYVIVDSNYVLKPVYGKLSLFNRALVYNELYFVVGGAVSYYSDGSFRPGPDVGVGLRFFVTDWLSVRADARHYVLFNSVPLVDPNATIDHVLYLTLGASFNLGGPA